MRAKYFRVQSVQYYIREENRINVHFHYRKRLNESVKGALKVGVSAFPFHVLTPLEVAQSLAETARWPGGQGDLVAASGVHPRVHRCSQMITYRSHAAPPSVSARCTGGLDRKEAMRNLTIQRDELRASITIR